MISAFKHIRLSGYNLTPVQSAAWDNSSTLRLGFGGSGLAYYSELTGISGYLKGLINEANADVGSLNNLQGNLYVTGQDGITIQVDPGLGEIKIVGNSGYFQGLSNKINTDLATTGSNLYNLLIGFSGGLSTNFASTQSLAALSGNIVQTGLILDSKINSLSGYVNSQDATFNTNLFNTGSTLNSRISSLSGYVNSQDTVLSDKIASTGSILDTKVNSLSGYTDIQDSALLTRILNTGITLDSKINSLSGYANATFVAKTSQQVFSTTLTAGLDAYQINFPVAFGTAPKILATLEVPGEVMYSLSTRSISAAGYTGVLSDNILEVGAKIHTFASTQV